MAGNINNKNVCELFVVAVPGFCSMTSIVFTLVHNKTGGMEAKFIDKTTIVSPFILAFVLDLPWQYIGFP